MRIRNILGAVAAATALLFGGVAIASPASASTLETGGGVNVPVDFATDWTARVVWKTDYNAVGTSSTQPYQIQIKQNSVAGTKTAKSVRVQLRKGYVGGPNVSSAKANITACPTTTAYVTCWTVPDITNALLSDSPFIWLDLWTGSNQTGTFATATIFYGR